MSKSTTNVHYLRPPNTFAENSLKRLESRIDRIEKEFQRTLTHLEERQNTQEGLARSELKSLIQKLENQLQKTSEGFAPEKQVSSKKDKKPLFDFLYDFWNGTEEEGSVDEFGMDAQFARRVKPFFDFLYDKYWRVTVKGLHGIPGKGRGLIVSNHSGTLPYDGAMIRLAVENDHPSRRDVRFLVEDFVYHFPFLGTFMYRTGGVRACPENAERLLLKNHLVAVFPEGVKGIGKDYKNRYRLQRFGRGGFIKLALKTNSPIIPTAVIGAEEIHPLLFKSTLLAKPFGVPYIPVTPTLPWLGPLGLIPLPSKWTIVFGEPIRFSPQYGPEDAEDQLLVNRLSETVREKIQQMIIEELKNRRSIWFG